MRKVKLSLMRWMIATAWARRNKKRYKINIEFDESIQQKVFIVAMSLDDWGDLANSPAGQEMLQEQ